IDTGSYLHFHPVLLSGILALNQDEGLTVTGPTAPAHLTDFLYAFPDPELIGVELRDARFVTLQHLEITFEDARRGLWVHQGSTDFTGRYLTVQGAWAEGIR